MNVSLRLFQESLTYVREARYLWVVIQLSGTDKDVHRQMRKYYAGINNSYKAILCMLIRCKMLLILVVYIEQCTMGNSGSIAPNIV